MSILDVTWLQDQPKNDATKRVTGVGKIWKKREVIWTVPHKIGGLGTLY